MGLLSTMFNWGPSSGPNNSTAAELPEIYPLPIILMDFISIDVFTIYSKILTDVCERTHGLTNDQIPLLFDNCLESQTNKGLISLLADAMTHKADLFIVYDPAINLVRRADHEEQRQIRDDYAEKGESDIGTFITFKNYKRTDMIKLYSQLEYCLIGSFHKVMHLANAIQLKIANLRGSVSLIDSDVARAQAQSIAQALGLGRDILIDSKDLVDTAKPDISSNKEAMTFIDSKRAFYLGLPTSYINGEQTGGIGSTGEADMRAVERGLKNYYFSIIKPVIEDIFDIQTSFKSQDFRMIQSGLEALKTFSLIDESLISAEDKKMIIDKLFELEADA